MQKPAGKSRWLLKPHATAISGHKILNGNLQSARGAPSQSMQGEGGGVVCSSIYLPHFQNFNFKYLYNFSYVFLAQKKWATFFVATRTCSCIFYNPNMSICGWMYRERRQEDREGERAQSEYVCTRYVGESRVCITSILCNLFTSSLSHSLSLNLTLSRSSSFWINYLFTSLVAAI